MVQRSSALTTTGYLTLLAYSCLCRIVSAQQTAARSNNETEDVCRPFGKCEHCPEDALHQPFCQPFGNRRLVHCTPTVNTTQTLPQNPTNPSPNHPPGELPAWESCGRIVAQERADFWEFVACIVFFAAISLFVLLARSKRLRVLQARQLAARIGVVRDTAGR